MNFALLWFGFSCLAMAAWIYVVVRGRQSSRVLFHQRMRERY